MAMTVTKADKEFAVIFNKDYAKEIKETYGQKARISMEAVSLLRAMNVPPQKDITKQKTHAQTSLSKFVQAYNNAYKAGYFPRAITLTEDGKIPQKAKNSIIEGAIITNLLIGSDKERSKYIATHEAAQKFNNIGPVKARKPVTKVTQKQAKAEELIEKKMKATGRPKKSAVQKKKVKHGMGIGT